MKKFEEFGLNENLLNNLKKQGISVPTPIQKLSIPKVLAGKDLLAEAQTGTGKTLAFLLPMFQQFRPEDTHIKGLIITPTRELAIQITTEAKKLAADSKITILAAFGGQDITGQLRKLNNGIDLVIATPGRLVDHINRGSIDLTHLKTLVLDEADQMLHTGFRDELETILSRTNKNKQILCFSATLNSNVKKLAYKFMRDPLEVTVKKETITLDTITQKIIACSDRWKQEALFKELDKTNPYLGIIFCRTKIRADNLEEAMSAKKYDCNKLHGDMTQNARQKVMKSFREAKFQYLIATDVASRGLDVTGISHIYNYDIPENSDIYIHRIGRTGRMGENGAAITFVAPRDEELMLQIEKEIQMNIPKEAHYHKSGEHELPDDAFEKPKKKIEKFEKNLRSRKPGNHKQGRKTSKHDRDPRANKDDRMTSDTRDSKSSRNTKDTRDTKASRNAKDTRDTKASRASGNGSPRKFKSKKKY